jgi:hypothetical protein
VFTVEQNTEDGNRKFLRNANKLLPDRTSLRCTRKWPFIFILFLFEFLLQQLRFKFVLVVFLSVTGATVSYIGMLYLLFSDPLILFRKLAVVRTREYFPCLIRYCKWFLCSLMDSLPSVDSVPLECPCSHLTDLTTKMGPTDCTKTSFSRLALCHSQASKRLFHPVTPQSIIDICETFVSVGEVSVLNLGKKTDYYGFVFGFSQPFPSIASFYLRHCQNSFFPHSVERVMVSYLAIVTVWVNVGTVWD